MQVLANADGVQGDCADGNVQSDMTKGQLEKGQEMQ